MVKENRGKVEDLVGPQSGKENGIREEGREGRSYLRQVPFWPLALTHGYSTVNTLFSGHPSLSGRRTHVC